MKILNAKEWPPESLLTAVLATAGVASRIRIQAPRRPVALWRNAIQPFSKGARSRTPRRIRRRSSVLAVSKCFAPVAQAASPPVSRRPQRFGDSRLGESILAVWQAVTDSIQVPRTRVARQRRFSSRPSGVVAICGLTNRRADTPTKGCCTMTTILMLERAEDVLVTTSWGPT